MAVAVLAPRVVEANPFLTPKGRPLVVGHRGLPLLHQENTLAGFRAAVAHGIDAIELDVRLTRDNRAVVFHDATVSRLTGVRRAIADMTWDEVSRLRIQRELRGCRVRYPREEPISLLVEVLAEVGDAIAINIELKPRWFGDDVASIVAGDLARCRLGRRVIITSYDPRKLRDTNRADPGLAVGYCWCSSLFGGGRRIVDRLLAGTSGVGAVGADHELLRDDTVRRLRGAGMAVGGHVVFPLGGRMTPASVLERLMALNLDWLESDDAVRLQRLVG